MNHPRPSHGPLIAREGWLFVLVALGLAVAASLAAAWPWAVAAWLLFAFVLQFFRDPPRTPPAAPPGEADSCIVVSPAHGKVVSIDELQDPFLKRPARRVSVFMNVFSIHSNRAPVGGAVMARWYRPGRFFNAALDKASDLNERNAVWIRTACGIDVVCVQIAGLVARRILCYVEAGDPIEGGERYGFIRFGSRVDVYLPADAEITARLGQWVQPGADVIARVDRDPARAREVHAPPGALP